MRQFMGLVYEPKDEQKVDENPALGGAMIGTFCYRRRTSTWNERDGAAIAYLSQPPLTLRAFPARPEML